MVYSAVTVTMMEWQSAPTACLLPASSRSWTAMRLSAIPQSAGLASQSLVAKKIGRLYSSELLHWLHILPNSRSATWSRNAFAQSKPHTQKKGVRAQHLEVLPSQRSTTTDGWLHAVTYALVVQRFRAIAPGTQRQFTRFGDSQPTEQSGPFDPWNGT